MAYSGDSESSCSESNESFRDREICVFYKRIGACRHGLKCSRLHIPPEKSRTIMIRNLFRHVQPLSSQIISSSPSSLAIFEDFYEEVFQEIDEAYGRINQMHVCENMGEHLIGNVYVKFYTRSSANRAIAFLNNRFFAGFPIFAELSPVEDFRDAVCRQHESGECSRGGFCNFLHIKNISRNLEDKLYTPNSKRRSPSPFLDSEFSDFSDDQSTSDPGSFYNSDSSFYSKRNSILTETSLCSMDSDAETIEASDSGKEGSSIDAAVPKAFRIKPLKPTSVESSSNSSDEEDGEKIADRHQQISRRLRWEIFRQKLEGSLEWDDERERQFVFNLLEMS